jgi:hypothetical protein
VKGKSIYKASKAVTYGVASLPELGEWLNEHLPPFDSAKYGSGWHE